MRDILYGVVLSIVLSALAVSAALVIYMLTIVEW